MSDLEVQLRNSLAALDDLKGSFEQQRLVWQQEIEMVNVQIERLRTQLDQARQREEELLNKNEQLTRKLVNLGSMSDSNPLLKNLKMVGAHLSALSKDADEFKQYAVGLLPASARNSVSK